MTTEQIQKKINTLHKKRDKIFERDIKPIEREIEKEVKYLWDEKKGFCERPESRRHSAENSAGSPAGRTGYRPIYPTNRITSLDSNAVKH